MKKWSRLVGILLLVVILIRLDASAVFSTLRVVKIRLFVGALLLNVPMLFMRVMRWRVIMAPQGINYAPYEAALAYLGSIYLGLVTPGRIGEFVKAAHVTHDCNVSSAHAFSSVLSDRLFDLYALLLVGGAALLTLGMDTRQVLAFVVSGILLTVPMAVFLHRRSFRWVQWWGLKSGRLGRRLFADEGWLVEMRRSFLQLTWPALLSAGALTVLAYAIFFGQCYLLALALEMPAGLMPTNYAVALGSLVTLLPISVSGLGTREAVIVAYLGTIGVSGEAALGFSLLVFFTFYVAGGLIGAVAWWIKPVPLATLSAPGSG